MKSSILLFGFLALSLLTFSQSYKFMSYNIRYDTASDSINSWNNRKETMVRLCKHYEPAIIGIQEGLYHQIQYLNSRLINYTYIGIGREDGKNKGEFSAVFYDSTKLKVLKKNTFWLSEKSDTISVGWDAALERICTYGLFENRQNGQKIWIFNTHFDHRGNLARLKSSELIIKKIKKINTENFPVVLMGDFNSLPDSKTIKIFSAFLDDAKNITQKPHYGPKGTFNGFDLEKLITDRIDYIFISGLKVCSHIHIDDKRNDNNFISDHLPVMIETKKQ